MALTKHDEARDNYGNPPRDATGTDPRSHSTWSYVIGIVVVALLAFAIFGSMTPTTQDTSTSSTRTSEPATTPQPAPPPTAP